MNRLALILLITVVFAACSADPRPIAFGQVGCHHCKMTLMDPKFGAELVTEKGKVFVFDDINCMLQYLDTEEGKAQQYKHRLVTDFEAPNALIDASTAFYLKGEAFQTPMASQVVAFSNYERMEQYKNGQGGVYLAWGELQTQFK
ncbi:nitrous oxide reductase [Algoriphagus lacus]|uniref:Nitrous oxide reductase n=1 Tax=Algoriphagus lacus TaxID=2056311 RepID=A0A418PUQ5_9BACT|nr:nitrous oxide reductase accessory protein NosL [Algoriphagus lacus]RIW17216.1 nitrous oxide reductase [Algoriphagus lacus]